MRTLQANRVVLATLESQFGLTATNDRDRLRKVSHGHKAVL